ncbi:motility protein A [Leifsonia sp. Leaf264]|uniref:motility protein A n=1 Tax=Leifsonia sp. Leaf264 TaxID=1736314 RepID=UPI0006FB42CC|nr:MotA/TolQ/ExbB proton channel family protein [Leifsonia sp. Leaf264]KQO98242.1 flagellar motor protein MotA [Leifsonia sp. Leaf264]
MDIALILGLVIAFGSIVVTVIIEGGHLESLILPGPMLLVIGATLGVGIASGRLSDALRAFATIPKILIGKTQKPQAVIDQMVQIAEKARKNGLLSLEQDAAETDDPFLKNALQNIADGTDSEELRVLLEEDLHSKIKEKKHAGKFFKMLGGYAPTIGVLGTVVSLTHVLENLDEPDTLGPSIAAAFVATLWGLLSANFIWLPLGDRQGRLAQIEEDNKTLIMEGALAIQSGTPARLLGERLRAMVADHELSKEK